MLFIILSCVAVICVYLWTSRKQNKDEPPTLPGRIPFIGHAHLVLGNSVKLLETITKYSLITTKLGGVATMWLGPTKFYVVSDPEDHETVVNTCLKKNRFYEFAQPWLGQGLITSSLENWKVHRRLLNPAFNQVVLDGFVDVFNSQSRRLVKDFEQNIGMGPFDHFPYIRLNALGTICLTALGIDFTDETIPNNNYVDALEGMLNSIIIRSQNLWLHSDIVFNLSPTKKKQDKYVETLLDISSTVLKKRKEEYLKNKNKISDEETQGPKFKPFMELLLELSIDKKLLSDTEVREHVDTIIVAGHDTAATVLTFIILMVGSFPNVQKKIIEELNNVFGDSDRDVMKEDFPKLIYLEAVIKETIRLFPVMPVMARTLDTDVKLRNYTLSKGHNCAILTYGLHRHPMWGPDADEFIPERWLDPSRLPKLQAAFAGFSYGKRVCIGRSYAYMSMKVTLSHLFRNYKINGDYTKLINKLEVLIKSESGHHIIIERRK